MLDLYDVLLGAATASRYSLSTKPGTTGTDIGDFLQQQEGLLRAVRGRAGLAGPGRRTTRPGSRSASPRAPGPAERVPTADQPEPARLDRGLLQRLRLGAVRRHAGRRAWQASVRTDWAPDPNSLKPTSSSSTGNDAAAERQHQRRTRRRRAPSRTRARTPAAATDRRPLGVELADVGTRDLPDSCSRPWPPARWHA